MFLKLLNGLVSVNYSRMFRNLINGSVSVNYVRIFIKLLNGSVSVNLWTEQEDIDSKRTVELWNCPRKASQCGMQSKGVYIGLKHSKSQQYIDENSSRTYISTKEFPVNNTNCY